MQYIVLSAGQEWNYYSWKDTVDNVENIRFINELFPSFLKKLWWRPYFRNKITYKFFWRPFIKSKLKIKTEPTVLIVYDWNFLTMSPSCIQYLKASYPNLKIIYVFTNIVKISGARTYDILEKLNQDYDMVFAFDPEDAKKYGFEYSRLVYSVSRPLRKIKSYDYDVFYIGQAKDRYSQLIDIYKKLRSCNLRCLFYITGVPKSEQYIDSGIVYNTPLHYNDVLELIDNSKCLVDVIQGDSAGLTIKTCEAVVLDKKLITTNRNVINEVFYDPNNILIYGENADVKKFMDTDSKNYDENTKKIFSPVELLERIKALDI